MFFLLPILAAIAGPAFAQRTIEPPVAGRPDDFSNIVGKYKIEISASPLEIHVEEPITLHVRIIGEGPSRYEPTRKHLRIFPDWNDAFFVENVPDEDRVLKAEKTWLFVYRLRPKRMDVKSIDDVKLVYFNPDKDKYEGPYAESIKITVKPKPDFVEPIVTKAPTPDSFYRVDETEAVLRNVGATLPSLASGYLLVLIAPPLVCLVGVAAYRRWFTIQNRRNAHQRSSASQRARTRLLGGDTAPWAVVCQYLVDRFDFSVVEPTPDDVAAWLQRRGFAKERCAAGREFFEVCDAARFDLTPADAKPLTEKAIRLIEALEADPCVR